MHFHVDWVDNGSEICEIFAEQCGGWNIDLGTHDEAFVSEIYSIYMKIENNRANAQNWVLGDPSDWSQIVRVDTIQTSQAIRFNDAYVGLSVD